MNIPYYDLSIIHNSIRNEILNSIEASFNSNQFILGKRLAEFETDYAQYVGAKYCIGVSNGLDALKLSLATLNIGKGDKVIVPSNTFVATVMAIELVGATPVLVEPDIRTYNMDPSNIESQFGSDIKAIIPVHLYGQSADMIGIRKIAQKHNVKVIEDAAQSHGGHWRDQMTGSIGDINATSFYPAKNLGGIGDSGAVLTDDKVLYERCKMLSNYGSKEKYVHGLIGYNNRMDELQAAVLSVKLKYLDDWNKERRKIAKTYLQALNGVGDIILPYTHPEAYHVYHIFVIRTLRRDELKAYLSSQGIATLIHYPIPPHKQLAFSNKEYSKKILPIAEKLANTSLSLPIFPGMSSSQIEYVCDAIRSFYNG